ncbi:SDR family NAD(P)-dependent oxidoreductase [Streptomyces sp. NPDC049881]|uniref:SDR family NAD(P)-dependent oxidoreductase n=1 Tax=Streptomyces sp. NPDC049881 TaxID=3155778 RepID=UPI003448A5B0
MPTAVVIGAGPGLGLAMARRLVRAGYRVALLSRQPGRHLDALRAAEGPDVDAAAFAADVRDPAALDRALDEVVRELGAIDFVYYGPSPHGVGEAQAPLDQVTGADVEAALTLVGPAADVVAKVLPGMRERGRGAFLFTSAVSAVVPIPALGAMTVPAAAARTYAVTLNAALAPDGIYAGVLLVGGLIEGSDIHTAMASAGGADPAYLLDPEQVADAGLRLTRRRKAPEALVMPGRSGWGLTLLLIARLLRVPKPRLGARKTRTAGQAEKAGRAA